MTNRLFYDTETTGFYNFKAAPSDPKQPRIVQLAWAFDKGEDMVEWNDHIIFPDGWIIPSVVTAIHGISTEIAREKGVDIKGVLKSFMKDYKEADIIVAHNISFDEAVLNSQLIRNDYSILPKKTTICTMHSTTNILKLPGSYNNYKWPKLEEAYRFLVNSEGFSGAHNALNDVRACRDLYYKLKENNMLST